MKKYLKFGVFAMMLAGLGATTAWAAFGPCTIYRPAATTPSTIGCYTKWNTVTFTCFCGGMITIIPEASSCSNTNSTPCSEINVEASIGFSSSGKCLVWYSVPGGVVPVCNGTCLQDPKTRWSTWSTPKDTNCNAGPVNPNPPQNTTLPVEE